MRASRRVCTLFGHLFALVMPPGEGETERDRLCATCLALPELREGRRLTEKRPLCLLRPEHEVVQTVRACATAGRERYRAAPGACRALRRAEEIEMSKAGSVGKPRGCAQAVPNSGALELIRAHASACDYREVLFRQQAVRHTYRTKA